MDTVEWHTNKKANPKGLCKAFAKLLDVTFGYLLKEFEDAADNAGLLDSSETLGIFNLNSAYLAGGYCFKIIQSINIQIVSQMKNKRRNKEFYQEVAEKVLNFSKVCGTLKEHISPLLEDHPLIQMIFIFGRITDHMINDEILTSGFFVRKNQTSGA